jgi:hypothetical protein
MKSSSHSLIPFLPFLLSHSTAISGDSLNYPAGLGFNRKHHLIVIAQRFFDCCLSIPFRGNLFTESLPSNKRLLWLRYSGFQSSCHKVYYAFRKKGICRLNCSGRFNKLLLYINFFPSKRGVTYTGCFTTLGHNCRRWFPRSLWSKKFI